ncbi:hypothetical protein GCM10009558_012680 [Virgisporangium aurantiacum]
MTKRYVSWSRGEHVREWTVLRRVFARCPDLDADPPFVVMSMLPGSPLTGIVDLEQQAALAEALRRLWSVPAVDLPARRHHPAEIHALMTGRMAGLDLPGSAGEAARAARSFLTRLRLGPAACTVLGHTDPNLANYLRPGSSRRSTSTSTGCWTLVGCSPSSGSTCSDPAAPPNAATRQPPGINRPNESCTCSPDNHRVARRPGLVRPRGTASGFAYAREPCGNGKTPRRCGAFPPTTCLTVTSTSVRIRTGIFSSTETPEARRTGS